MRRRRLFRITLFLLPLALSIGLIAGAASAEVALLQIDPEQAFIFDARADLEVLADDVFGEGERPETWMGTFDTTAATVVVDLWFDNEQLADAIFGPGERPEGWSGASIASANTIARNVRRDLELAADRFYGINQRPDRWRGVPSLLRCDRTLQNTLAMLDRFYAIRPQTPDSALNFCQAIAAEIEDELTNIIFGTPRADGRLPDAIFLLSTARGDLERLADELLGLNTRPPGYSGSRDLDSPNLIGDIFLDMNLLADDVLGSGQRPRGWIGIVVPSPGQSYFNLRFDLELLTDETLGRDVRPTGWQAVEPIERCRPAVRSLVFLVEQNYNFSLTEIDPEAESYCAQVEEAINAVVENPPVLDIVEEQERLTGTSNFAFAYLDVAATQYMGIMPGGTRFRAVYRNFGESNMMFVSGADFALYIDRRFTTLPETVFNSLPTLENVRPIAFCDASWCNGPGPTPTPTGSGPLIAVLVQTTPVATPNPQQLQITKQLVSWNFIRVTYVQDNVAARTAQVALEICTQPAQTATACEPVISVFDNSTGANRPVLSQFNGLNVFEFRYGYTTNVVIESETRFSNDVWISDPTIR